MLQRAHRFHGLAAVSRAYGQGKTVRAETLGLRYSLNTRRKQFRTAVVVSKRVHKSAVTRNRIRRRIYECIRAQQSAIAKPYDIIITAYDESAATMPPTELQQLVEKLLKKASIIA